MRLVNLPSVAYPQMKLPQTPSTGAPARLRTLFALAGLAALAGCAQPVQQTRSRIERSPGEYFPEGRYGRASPRVVGDGEAVPRGGGKYLVGRPYTIAGKRYFPSETPHESQTGMASYYGGAFHGRKTANGEVFDMASISAAHPTMPLPSYARVTNTRNGRSIIVRVNDRGPYHGGRVMDVSQRVAEVLDFKRAGTAQVRVDYVGKASLGGSDDEKLVATLRTDGRPASLDGGGGGGLSFGSTLFARNEPAAPPPPQPQRVAIAPEPVAVEMRRQPVVYTPRTALVASAPPPQPAAFAPEPPPFAPGKAPLPPVRPFDLGTIPGAGVPVAASRNSAAPIYTDPVIQPARDRGRVPVVALDTRARPNGPTWTPVTRLRFPPSAARAAGLSQRS